MPPRAAPRSAPARAAPGPNAARTWRLVTIDRGYRQVITARAVVNAAGAWTSSVAETVLRVPPPKVATVQMSQIVVRRLFDSDNVYVFQNSDGRLIFASPYERDFTLIGTVGHAFKGDPAIVAMAAGDVAYLCDAANRYFRERIEPSTWCARFPAPTWRRSLRAARRGTRVTLDARARQGAAAHDFRRRRHDLAAACGEGGVEADAVLSDVATLDCEGPAARRRFCLGSFRQRGRRSAGTLAISRRGPGAASGRSLWLDARRPSSATPESAATSARLLGRN